MTLTTDEQRAKISAVLKETIESCSSGEIVAAANRLRARDRGIMDESLEETARQVLIAALFTDRWLDEILDAAEFYPAADLAAAQAAAAAATKEATRLRDAWKDTIRACELALANGFDRINAADMLKAARNIAAIRQ